MEKGGVVIAYLNDFNRCISCYGWGKKRHFKRERRKFKEEIKDDKKFETSSTTNVASEENGKLLAVILTTWRPPARPEHHEMCSR
ncbi:hypothetical protein ACOSP7_028584 [Xanthoceras sorbifolium]